MDRLVIWLFLLVALFTGYWFTVAQVAQNGVQQALDQARSDGWQVETADMGVSGFPGTFSLQLVDPVLVAPNGAWTWRGSDIEISAASINPTRPTAVFPAAHTVQIGDQTLQIDVADMQAGAAASMNAALHFDDGFASLTDAAIVSDAGWQAQISNIDALAALVEDSKTVYDVDLTITDVALPEDIIAQLVPAGALGPTVSRVAVDAALTFDRGLERVTQSGASLVVSRVDLADFNLVWADIVINAEGALDINDQGVPEGQVVLKSAQWEALIELLGTTGAIDPQSLPTLTTMAGAMAGADGALELPITFSDGVMSMGVFPLGPAPVLR